MSVNRIHLIQPDRTHEIENGDMIEERIKTSACGVWLARKPGEEIDYTFNPLKVTCGNCQKTDYFEKTLEKMRYK